MKVKRFLKRLGIYTVPVLVTIILLLAFNAMLQWTFDVCHPDELSQLFFTIGKQAVSHVMVDFVVAIWIFACMMRWAKEKDLRMRAKELGVDYDMLAADAADNNPGKGKDGEGNGSGNNKPADDKGDETHGEGIQVRITSFSFSITTNIQKWFKCTRYLANAVHEGVVVGNVHLDIPTEDERKKDDFWQKCDAFIYALWVDGAYRNRHIATRLLEVAERNAKEQGCKTVALEWNIREAEEWTLKWYLHRGYEEREFGKGISFLVKTLDWNEEENRDEQPAQEENHGENPDENHGDDE